MHLCGAKEGKMAENRSVKAVKAAKAVKFIEIGIPFIS
jgi:hypothetical protein